MKCEICNQREATVSIKRVIEGRSRELFVCEPCAGGAVPESPDLMSPLIDLLFGIGPHSPSPRHGKETACPACGMTRSVFRERRRLGCPECYTALIREIRPILKDTQSSMNHCGKTPTREKQQGTLAELRKRLASAVHTQNFEEAARLRDRIQFRGKSEENGN